MRAWGTWALIVALLLGAAPAFAAADSPAFAAADSPDPSPSRVQSRPPLPVSTLDVGPVPGAEETRIHWTRWSRRLVYGATSVLEGQVVVGEGEQAGSLPDAEVDLYARRAGTSGWRLVGTAVSSSDDAVFAFSDHRPSANTAYRVVYEGDLFYARSQATRRVDVARRVPDTLRRIGSSRFALRGSVAPTYRDRRVVLQRRTCARCSWSAVAAVRTSPRSRWGLGLPVPPRPGTWYYRVLVPGDRLFVRGYGDHVWELTRR